MSSFQVTCWYADCSFINGVYTGEGEQIISYDIDKSRTSNIISQDLVRIY